MSRPDDTRIDRIRRQTDLVRLISKYVVLTQAGSFWTSACPFHDDHASCFVVNPESGTFVCTECGQSGDCFAFVEQFDGVNFVTAGEIVERGA